MHEMEREMSEAIAKYTPFSASDVFSAWLSFKSFDLILRAVEFARVFGIASVNEATNHLVEDYVREQRSGLTQRAADGAVCTCEKDKLGNVVVRNLDCPVHSPRR